MRIKMNLRNCVRSVVFILGVTALSACSEPSDQELVLSAKNYLSQVEVREAIIELKNALQENPQNAEARYLLGEINLNLGDIASAEKEFKRAAQAGWPEEQVQIGLARAMLARNALQALLDESKVKDSYSAGARANLYALHAEAQVRLGHLDQAAQLLSQAKALDAKALYVLKSTVLIQFAMGHAVAAKKSMALTLAVYRDKQELLLLKALVADSNNDLIEAVAAYRKVIALEPPGLMTVYGRKARLSLAKRELINGRLDQAQATLAPLFEYMGEDSEVNYLGGFLAFKQDKLDLAEKRLLRVLNVVPEYVQAQLLLGTINYSQGDFEQAAYYVARYVGMVQSDLRARKFLARVYSKLGQREKALAVLEPALKDHAKDAELLALNGLLQLQEGDTVSGISGLERAVSVAPEDLILKNKLARAYIFSGNTESALKVLNTVLAEGGDKKQGQALLVMAHMEAGQFSRAINVVHEMLRDFPDDPGVLTLAGNVYEASKNRAEADKYFNRALQINPDYLPAGLYLARLEELGGDMDKAKRMYKKLAQTNKKDINALLALARIAATQNKLTEMVDWLQQAAGRSPQDVVSRKKLVEYYLQKKQLREAARVLKEAQSIAPDDSALLDLSARLYMAKGQYNEALSSLNKLVAKMPGSAYIRTMVAEVYLKLGRQADVRRQLDVVLKKQEEYVPALVLMANLELLAGHSDKALAYAAKVQKLRPDLYIGFELAGDALMRKKDYVTAKINYEQAWQRKSFTELVIKRSQVLLRAGRVQASVRPLLDWLKDYPDDVRVLLSLGEVFQRLKQNSKAIEAYEKVLKMRPNNVTGANNLAWLYSLANNPRALELAERAYRLRPEDGGVQDTYGWILVKQGRLDEGLNILEKAIKVLPNIPEVQYHYAVALLRTGGVEQARKILGNLLESGKSFEGREDAANLLK